MAMPAARFGVLAALAVWAVGAAAACDEGRALCTTSTQCPAGHVCADGVCSPTVPGDGPLADGLVPDGGADRGPDQTRPDVGRSDGDAGLTCTPNNNGKVERSEMLFVVPSQVKVTRGTSLTVNLTGTTTSGTTEWDLTAAAVDDKAEVMKLVKVPSWAAASFPKADYSAELSQSYGLLFKVNLMGVFKVTSTALQSLGAVSDTANHTKLTYSTPIETLRFPVSVGQKYTSSATVTGLTEYTIPALMKESYAIKVLARGKAKLYSTFSPDALLVRVDHEVYPVANPLLKVKNTVFFLVAECYGTIAHMLADGTPGANLDKVKIKQRWKLAAP